MFKDKVKNRDIVEGAYRKFKSYYYYNKNFLLIKEKIADFESNPIEMERIFNKLVEVLENNDKDSEYISNLINKIDIIALPKKFKCIQDKGRDEILVSNSTSPLKEICDINFFIDMPIDLFILDTIFCICIGKIERDGDFLSADVYGNVLNKKALFYNQEINWENNSLFQIYFNQYSQWRNNAFDCLEKNYKEKKDSVLITMDIRSYYYSIILSKQKLKKILGEPETYNSCRLLFEIHDMICSNYFKLLQKYKKFEVELKEDEYCLPIGLLSSMILANIYLVDFDKKIKESPNLYYYGRYVDDIILVYNGNCVGEISSNYFLLKYLEEKNLVNKCGNNYSLWNHPELFIQTDKIKILYFDHNESRALIDIYNNSIKILPSQIQPIPDWDLELEDFDESVYLFDKFSQSNKIRDLGNMSIDPYSIGKYFSHLTLKFSNISNKKDKNIDEQIKKINAFFCGNQGIEYYTQWQNYLYFLILVDYKDVRKEFYLKMGKDIQDISYNEIDKSKYKYPNRIIAKVKKGLLKHLKICYYTAYTLRYGSIDSDKHKAVVKKFIQANMFNHNLLALPLSNYLYDGDKSLLDISIEDINIDQDSLLNNDKIKWSPRFIHFAEVLMMSFYYQHNHKKSQMNNVGDKKLIDRFIRVNHIKGEMFEITQDMVCQFKGQDDYILEKYSLPSHDVGEIESINICTGNVYLKESDCIKFLHTGKIDLDYKKKIWSILKNTYKECDQKIKILVLPELFYPICLIKDLLSYSRKAQIGIITGLQYLSTSDKYVKNYIATVLPFTFNGYKNSIIYIREKNDYSPIERHDLAKEGYLCVDSQTPKYQVYSWQGINISPIVCFELTDIMARALLKGETDIIALSVFNKDTTYFSNIIDSATRDLHCAIVQANTSKYGDSRVTLPYDRDSKDVFKIKGGKNDNVMVGELKLGELFNYQRKYYLNDQNYVNQIFGKKNKKLPKCVADLNIGKGKPCIKRLSARFKNSRTRNN